MNQIIVGLCTLFILGGQRLVQGQPTIGSPADAASAGTNPAEDDSGATTVQAITATAASGGALTYVVTGHTPSTTPLKFEFSSANMVTVSNPGFDYETATEYLVTYEVREASGGTATQSLTVSIDDVDEFTPVFSATSYCRALSSSIASGDNIGTYDASDLDGSAAKRVQTYALTGDDSSAKFTYNSGTGVMTKSANAFTSAKTTYYLVLTAVDTTHTATATLTVFVDGSSTACSGAPILQTSLTVISTVLAFILYHSF